MRPRRAVAITVAAVATLALLRSAPDAVLRLLPPCPIHQAFGILCPGCGSTRALLALLHGDLPAAWHSNPLLLALLPLLVTYAVLRRQPRLPPPAIAALCVAILAFTVARNL